MRIVLGMKTFTGAAFPGLVEAHLVNCSSTRAIEAEAIELRRAGFPSLALTRFIMHVCTWGGFAGVAARVFRANTREELKEHFEATDRVLWSETSDAVAALRRLNRVSGLGQPSFASKHLRFMSPEFCPVLDSIVADGLGYPSDPFGYGAWASDARAAAGILESQGLENPMRRPGGRWFAADVDMAVFASLRGW